MQPAAPTKQVAFRLPPELIKALERRLAAERKARPGERVTRSDVVRRILAQALLGQNGGAR